jgi:IPT/TIG domain
MIQHIQAQLPEFFTILLANQDLPGEKMNASGSLLYTPVPQGFATVESNGIQITDTHLGTGLGQVLLAEQLGTLTQNVMDFDETGNRLFLITNQGLTVVQMPSPALSIGYLNPATGSTSGGTTVTIRGSGFESGAAVSIGGSAANTTFVDSSTLQIVTPSGSKGGARVSIQNSGGTPYSLDAGFTYQ